MEIGHELGPFPGDEQVIIDVSTNHHYCCGICHNDLVLKDGTMLKCFKCGMLVHE